MNDSMWTPIDERELLNRKLHSQTAALMHVYAMRDSHKASERVRSAYADGISIAEEVTFWELFEVDFWALFDRN